MAHFFARWHVRLSVSLSVCLSVRMCSITLCFSLRVRVRNLHAVCVCFNVPWMGGCGVWCVWCPGRFETGRQRARGAVCCLVLCLCVCGCVWPCAAPTIAFPPSFVVRSSLRRCRRRVRWSRHDQRAHRLHRPGEKTFCTRERKRPMRCSGVYYQLICHQSIHGLCMLRCHNECAGRTGRYVRSQGRDGGWFVYV